MPHRRYVPLLTALALTTRATAGAQAPVSTLRTRWASAVSADHVLPEYPRPQLARAQWINLNGSWDYALRDSGGPAPHAFDGKILVPFPVESQLSGVTRPVSERQRLWYHRTVHLPVSPRGTRWLLHFGAVDWEATVYWNGHRLGMHRGGYDPFTFDVTDAVATGEEQDIVVSVWDPTDSGEEPRGKQVLHPGSIWYTAVTGIWQTVWLEAVPATYVDALTIVPDIDSGLVRVSISAVPAPVSVTARITIRAGDSVVARAEGRTGQPISLRIPKARLWSPADPFLYHVSIALAGGDSVTSYVGMRAIAVARDAEGTPRLFLNHQALFEFGTLDQGWWPDGLYTAPTEDARRYDLTTVRDLGFNLLRKHVKVEPERWYYDCDSLGLLVWQDMPSGDVDSQDGRDEYAVELAHVVDALRNHPSIVMWVPFNEGWGQHDTRRTVAWLEHHDPTRLVDNASGWTDRNAGSVFDVHSYPGPDIPPEDSSRARVLGEFGGLGLPIAGHTWVSRDNWGYVRYATPDSLWAAYSRLLDHLRVLIGEGLAAAVYTQTTDVEVETNGVMTYDREVVKLPPAARDAARRLYAPTTGGGTVTKSHFGAMPGGAAVDAYTLTNARGMTVRVLTYGGIIQSLVVPDATGSMGDVVLGFDSLDGYLTSSPYFGAIVGRYANRIAAGRFTLDGTTYHLAVNNGPNALHGGVRGFDKVIWDAEPFQRGDSVGVVLRHTSPDGDEGYPGTLRATVTYTLTSRNELLVDYDATTDRATPLNLSQHSYFNLAGAGVGDVLGHVLTIDADRYTPVDSTLIPTGELAPLAGTPFDFRVATAIGARIGQDDAQLRFAGGYDHNFVLNRAGGTGLLHAARVVDPRSGRTLDIYTDQPGLQFYSGNFLDGTIIGKGGHRYAHRGGLCLETQHFPDSPNHPQFPSAVLRPGQHFTSRTRFAFGVAR